MEKDNKYYNIIENLVKSNRKFNGYDAILDDIIDDVYKHSKTVLESVRDKDVILSYLQKLVSVSVITVPKRMNFHSELKHREITRERQIVLPAAEPNEEVPSELENDITPISEYQINDEQKANVKLVDKMINSIDSSSIAESNKTDNMAESDSVALTEDSQPEFTEEESELFELDIENTVAEEVGQTDASPENEPENNIEDFEGTEEIEVSTESFDIVSDEVETLEPVEESFEENVTEPNDIISDEVETLEPVEDVFEENITETNELISDEVETLEPVEESFEENVTEPNDIISDEVETLEPVEDVFEENITETNELISDEVENLDPIEEGFENSLEPIEFASNEDNLLGVDENFIIDNNEFENIEQNLNENDNIDITLFDDNEDNPEQDFGIENSLTLEPADATIEEYNTAENTEPAFKPVDYSLFNYVPETHNEDIDIQNLENKLAELNEQKPELNILKIFDLKYKQNLPITEIAEKLQIEKQDVLSALDEIVDLI